MLESLALERRFAAPTRPGQRGYPGLAKFLTVEIDCLPLLPDNRCLVWEAEPRSGGKFSKTPFVPEVNHRRRASDTDPSTWGTWAVAIAAYRYGHYDGIGFVLTGCGEVAIDLDNCRDPETGIIS